MLPGGLCIVAFFLLPLFFILQESFVSEEGKYSLTLYIQYLQDPKFYGVFYRTLKFGLMVTFFSALLSYPASYAISRARASRKSLLMSIVILPLMTSPVARTYAWMIILGRFGLINQTLRGLGIIQEPLRLMYTEGAVIVGLLQLFLPLMVLNLVSAMENISVDLEEAAQSLGASRRVSFLRVIVPLSADGLVMGSVLVFTGSITAYVTPAILGGTKILTLATLLQQEVVVFMNWGAATVIAVVMTGMTLLLYLLLRKLRPRAE
ncbi:MAG: ABC transporter permease [Spirochaetales bacterium]